MARAPSNGDINDIHVMEKDAEDHVPPSKQNGKHDLKKSKKKNKSSSGIFGCFGSRKDRDPSEAYAPIRRAETREQGVQVPSEGDPGWVASADGHGTADIGTPQGDTTDSSRPLNRPRSTEIKSVTDAAFWYKTKSGNGPTGKGLLAVVAMFTQDLKGYEADRQNLKKFFGEELLFDVMERVNCNQSGLISFIKSVQKMLQEDPSYDRLVFAVMTHGLQGGLQTCADSYGYDDEKDAHGKELLISVDKVVSYFKHDNAPTLKNLPKLFLIQACRGTALVKAAAGNMRQFLKPIHESDLSIRLERTVPVDADILVFYASTEEHYSFVHPTRGSWLIETTVDVFRQHHRRMHVEEMVTIVINAIPELRMTVQYADGSKGNAVQIPIKVSTLRRLFYLYNENFT